MAVVLERAWPDLALVALGGLLLGLPVLLLNGFPLTFDDTPGYFEPAFNLLHAGVPPSWIPPPEPTAGVPFSTHVFFLRPFPYTMFLLPFANGWGVWLVPVAQGMVAALAIQRALSVAGLGRPVVFLGMVAVLALLSSLPIHAGTIMPDTFTGPLILAAYATVQGWAERSRGGRWFDIVFLTGLTSVHLSHVAILAGLTAALGAWTLLWRRGQGLGAVAFGLGAPLVLVAGLLMTANLALAGRAVLSESSPVFLLARLIGDGPARDYLADACPAEGFLLCAERDRLNREAPGYSISDYFLWHREGARHVFGDTPRFVAEAGRIVRGTIATRPLDVAGHIAINAARELMRVALDRSLSDPVKPWTHRFFSRFPERVYAAFLVSRQARQDFPRDALNVLQTTALGLSVLALAWVGVLQDRRLGRLLGRPLSRPMGQPMGGLLAVIALGLLLNAIATGGLSAVHERYQNRVIWLVPLAAMTAMSTIRHRRLRGTAATPLTPSEGTA